MNKSLLKDDLLGLKDKLLNIEKEFEDKLKDVNSKQDKFISLDEKLTEYLECKDKVIHLNIGGKIFQTKISTLLKVKDTLFYTYLSSYITKGEEVPKELFFDRNYKYFPFILEYLRTNKFNLKQYNRFEREDLREELTFYGIPELISSNKYIGTLLEDPESIELLTQWINRPFQLELVYKASTDGFSAATFHSKCVNIPNNIVICQTEFDKLIGGYTPLSWKVGNSEYDYLGDSTNQTFLFSITNKMKYAQKDTTYSICNSISTGPKYGGGHDLEIVNNCNITKCTYYGLGHSFTLIGTKEQFYGTSLPFLIKDYEVHRVIFD